MFGKAVVDTGDRSHHAVAVDWDGLHIATPHRFSENHQDLLGSSQREGGKENVSLVGNALTNPFDETSFLRRPVGVKSISVGAFENQHVGVDRWREDAGNSLLVGDGDIAAKENALSAFLDFDHRRPEDVSGRKPSGFGRAELLWFAPGDRFEACDDAADGGGWKVRNLPLPCRCWAMIRCESCSITLAIASVGSVPRMGQSAGEMARVKGGRRCDRCGRA